MKRLASIDFLRGCAIVGMVLVHVLARVLDFKYLVGSLEDQPLFNVVALAVFPYLGGLAGFFLLVSAIGNMISMQKRLQAGKPVNDLVVRQVAGGILLLIFAFLTESTLGYHGALGDFFHNLHRPAHPDYLGTMLSRGFLVETIHTIAWCVLLNGIVQGILSRNGAWRNVRSQVTAYAVLAFLVVAFTQPVWHAVQVYAGSNGYPWDMATGDKLFLPNILAPESNLMDVLKGVFINPLAAPVEPLFPYLAVSFVGSIIGIILSQQPERVPRHFPRLFMVIGLGLFVVGTAGIVWFLASIANGPDGVRGAIDAYRRIPFHRDWYNNPNVPESFTFPFAWLWQFLSVNGLAIILTMFAVRLIEFRGRGADFAGKTTFVRRFGYIAFTNYNNQWYMFLVQLAFGVIIALTGAQALAYPSYAPGDGFNPYESMNWVFTLATVMAVFAVYHAIMRLWERVGYVGSLEWLILTIVHGIFPRKSADATDRWWQKGKLDVANTFYDANWIDIVRDEDIDHANLEDSKLALKVTLIGLLSIIFMPAAFATLKLAREAQESEGKNAYNRAAKALSIAGICLMIGALIPLFFITPRMF